jgi:hypothetical protein
MPALSHPRRFLAAPDLCSASPKQLTWLRTTGANRRPRKSALNRLPTTLVSFPVQVNVCSNLTIFLASLVFG